MVVKRLNPRVIENDRNKVIRLVRKTKNGNYGILHNVGRLITEKYLVMTVVRYDTGI